MNRKGDTTEQVSELLIKYNPNKLIDSFKVVNSQTLKKSKEKLIN